MASNTSLKIRLSVLNFLEFAVWGSYLVSMGMYLGSVGLGQKIFWFYTVQGLVSIFMPALIGIVADRWIPAQRTLRLCHLLAGAFMILTVSPVKAVLFLVFIIVLQQIEGNLIYPKVVGSSIGLPGIWVLAAITIGGSLLGVFGMLLAVPITAAIYRLLREDLNRRENKE